MPASGVVVVALLVICIGLFSFFQPAGAAPFLRHWASPAGLWIAAGLRLGIGALLWLAAPRSRTPCVLRALSVLVVVSGLALPILGLVRLQKWVSWLLRWPPEAVQLGGLGAALLGGFLLWTVLSRDRVVR